ncbi:MAG: hypothetical protein JXD18_09935 [Anaerolineae bacterium]|nr:hypothetical protein [Anaerolineae bacterium]
MHLTLSACLPFSLRAVIDSHGWSQLAPFAVEAHNETLTRIECLSTGRVVELCIHETTGGASVEAKGRFTGAEREEVGYKVWWMLGLGQDFSPFYRRIRNAPKLAHVEPKAMGRLLRSPSVFEDAVKTILTTNTTWQGTIRMVEAIVAAHGTPLPTDPSRHAFPTPQQLAATHEAELRGLGLGYRAPYVLELAQHTAGGSVDLEALKELPDSEVRQRLRALKGIGEYAATSLMVLLGHYDHIPTDSWATKLVSQEWYGGEPVGREEVERAFAPWGEWKALVYWFWDWSS